MARASRITGTARTLTLTSRLIPVFIMAALAVLVFFGGVSVMKQVTSTVYGCKVTKLEKVAGSANELLIHTDSCNDSQKQEGHIFRVDTAALADNFEDEQFYSGVKAGKTFNLVVEGVRVPTLDMVPNVIKVSEDFMPY